MPLEVALGDHAGHRVAWIAEFCAEALRQGQRLRVLVEDDAWLPDLSNALDLAIRPLCLVVPAADFTAHITLRATLSLMRSRITRHADEDWQAAWASQQAWLEAHNAEWQAALAWSASEASTPWPADIAALFPVCITPARQALRLWREAPALALVFDDAVLPEALDAQLQHSRLLLLTHAAAPPPTGGALILADRDAHLRLELEAVTAEIAELELELATVQGELAEFTHRYHDLIGSRMTRLDALQAELALRIAASMPKDSAAQAEAAAAEARARQSEQDEARYRKAAADEGEAPPFRPSADIRKLFRQVAQRIHPDRARDEADRDWRTQLMAEANRAYRAGDAHTLREVMDLWREGSAGKAPRDGDNASAVELQLQRMQRRLAEIQRELNALFASRLYELFLAERMARKQRRELLQEMAAKLDLQIGDTETRLAAFDRKDAP